MDGSELESPNLDRLRQRDPDAFARLVDQHQPLVLALAQSMGLHGADLDDAAAEVFDHVYRALPTFQARAQLRTWLYRIALRTLARFRHRLHRRSTNPLPPDLRDPAQPPPAQRLENAELHQRIWAAVASLDPRQAAAVELHYRQNWPLEQIADALECPVGTVKTLLFRARQSLRQTLNDQEITP